jgi:Transposase and inactivated derivatives
MTPDCRQIHRVVGIDVGKTSVTLHDLASDRTIKVANEVEALREALEPLRDCDLAVCEATGGHEDVLLDLLHALSIPVHRAHGGRVSAFARSFGLAKTDRIDARILAVFGRERGAGLPRWTPADAIGLRLVALVRRRADLVELRKRERARTKGPRAGFVDASIARTIAFLDAEIDELEARIKATIAEGTRLRARHDALRSIPGIGPTVAAGLLALMPELGFLDRRAAASLAALAPHPRDSGTIRKRRVTTGGRRELRPLLFNAALAAVRGQNLLATFFKRLVDAGKPKLLALTAVMRKIIVVANARIREVEAKLT